MASRKCKSKQCGRSFPIGLERCPHCARPGLFSNVDEAKLPAERRALKRRYRTAIAAAAARNCAGQAQRFEAKLADSRAVVNRSGLETARLASSERELFSTFYQLLKAEVRLPSGEVWDRLRRIADEALFPGYNRAKLGVAKVAERLEPTTAEADFPNLLLRQGATSGEDDFVEVHIWGPLSVYCIESVLVARRPASLSPALFLALHEILAAVDLEPEELE